MELYEFPNKRVSGVIMKAETIIYRNKFAFVLTWERLAIADYVQRSLQSGFSVSPTDAYEFGNEFPWEWAKVASELKINDHRKIMLSIIAIDQIINHSGAENFTCAPGLN